MRMARSPVWTPITRASVVRIGASRRSWAACAARSWPGRFVARSTQAGSLSRCSGTRGAGRSCRIGGGAIVGFPGRIVSAAAAVVGATSSTSGAGTDGSGANGGEGIAAFGSVTPSAVANDANAARSSCSRAGCSTLTSPVCRFTQPTRTPLASLAYKRSLPYRFHRATVIPLSTSLMPYSVGTVRTAVEFCVGTPRKIRRSAVAAKVPKDLAAGLAELHARQIFQVTLLPGRLNSLACAASALQATVIEVALGRGHGSSVGRRGGAGPPSPARRLVGIRPHDGDDARPPAVGRAARHRSPARRRALPRRRTELRRPGARPRGLHA